MTEVVALCICSIQRDGLIRGAPVDLIREGNGIAESRICFLIGNRFPEGDQAVELIHHILRCIDNEGRNFKEFVHCADQILAVCTGGTGIAQLVRFRISGRGDLQNIPRRQVEFHDAVAVVLIEPDRVIRRRLAVEDQTVIRGAGGDLRGGSGNGERGSFF